MLLYFTHINTALGKILLLSDGTFLTGLYFDNQKHIPLIDPSWQKKTQHPLFNHVEQQLTQYFQGTRQTFEIPYSLKTGTVFQQKVWGEIAKIPCGTVLSYRQLAELIGTPQSTRAVANATGHNPISLIIPCHRIVGSNGSLTGYAGGLERKRVLLELEKENKALI